MVGLWWFFLGGGQNFMRKNKSLKMSWNGEKCIKKKWDKTRLQLGVQLEKLKKVQNDKKQRELKEIFFDQNGQLLFNFFLLFCLGPTQRCSILTPPKIHLWVSRRRTQRKDSKELMLILYENLFLNVLESFSKDPPPLKKGGGVNKLGVGHKSQLTPIDLCPP